MMKTIIRDLGFPRFKLRYPIDVDLAKEGTKFIASFPEADLSVRGNTPEEALQWMKAAIVNLFHTNDGKFSLDRLPLKQAMAMEKYVKVTELKGT